MKIRVVSSKEEIETLHQSEEMIHLAFRPSNTDIFSMIAKCPKLKAIHMPTSYNKTLSKSSLMFLEMQGVKILEGDLWGHREAIEEYSEISQHVYDSIGEYRQKGMSDEDILTQMKTETGLSLDILSFLINRTK
ncbi:Protein of unknown function (DUF1699) [Methanomethylovorans hollandica DSM 15978]|uniref:DUF1699 family protein n=1 Tax=Methanomethylovorans hollandica (strain DSM 15978 / NBRC 107637 / DMS1) TaxID=867904 RepID=L0L1G9_METHD|nr:DUF1699 family protein [Methanomethylovorans hollandica]AGB50238.1 Protein of unknown function (DUF1699) [Methanomethylovorans hollandica DSM 15978]